MLGLIDQPYTRERFMGGLGRAEMVRDGVRTAARDARLRRRSPTRSSTRPFPRSARRRSGAAFEAVRDRVRLTRYGFDCYAYALVALGQVDLVIEAGLQPYDIAGAAGGDRGGRRHLTDWTGGPAHRGGRVLAAGDARVHARGAGAARGGGVS